MKKSYLFLAVIFFVVLASCSKSKYCNDVDAGIVGRAEADESNLDYSTVNTFVYVDQDLNYYYYAFNSVEEILRKREQFFKCLDDDAIYNLNYEFPRSTYSFISEDDDTDLRIIEESTLSTSSGIAPNERDIETFITDFLTNSLSLSVLRGGGFSPGIGLYTNSNIPDLPLDENSKAINDQLVKYDSFEFNGKIFFNVYSNEKIGVEGTEVFFTKEQGLIQFTDKSNRQVILDSIIYR